MSTSQLHVSDLTNRVPPQATDRRQAHCRLQLLARRRIHLERWRVARSERPFWRLYWNPVPGAWLRRGRRRIPLQSDRWFLIAPETSFAVDLSGMVEHCYAHLLLGQPFDSMGPLIIEREVDTHSGPLLTSFFDPDHSPGAGAQQLPALMALLGQALHDLPPSAWPQPPGDEAIAVARRAMEADPSRNWRNAELAALAGLPPTTFNRRFRLATGCSPQAQLLRLRMDWARILLEHDDRPIEMIASACGFGDRSHFSTVFKRSTGQAPASYRRHSRLTATEPPAG